MRFAVDSNMCLFPLINVGSKKKKPVVDNSMFRSELCFDSLQENAFLHSP